METIKNYLETMFANMPNTAEVKKAKAELLAMMEDKYNELISEGKSENEAVGAVISDFGNLDDLAEELGIGKEVQYEKEYTQENPRRNVSMDEVVEYIDRIKKKAYILGLGIFFCINCVVPILFVEGTRYEDTVGVTLMFVFIAIGAGLIVFSAVCPNPVDYIHKESCKIDANTVEFVKDERQRFGVPYTIEFVVGVIACALCWLPAAVFDEIAVGPIIGAALLFVLVGIGVFLIVESNIIYGTYNKLLKINDVNTISGSYVEDEQIEYTNKTVETIMSVYWPTVTCAYFIWSFLTFNWNISWIIWPLASILYRVLKINFRK